jgi:Protein-L-isoaspartate(D-aspartate) O-methyltransferase (PCMT)
MAPTSHSTQWVAEEFARRAATYDSSEMHRWQTQTAAQLLDLDPGQRILDIATGTGLAARAVVELTERTSVVGIVAHRLLREAAAAHDLPLPNPHADYGNADRIRAVVEDFGITLARVERDTAPDFLDDEPRSAFERVIDYGFAEPVRTASDDLREAIFDTYAALYSAASVAATAAATPSSLDAGCPAHRDIAPRN